MGLEEKQIILRVLQAYLRSGSTTDEKVMVTCLPPDKTSYVERIGEDGRILLFDEYNLDGKVVWASYSPRTGTVYFSLKSAPRLPA